MDLQSIGDFSVYQKRWQKPPLLILKLLHYFYGETSRKNHNISKNENNWNFMGFCVIITNTVKTKPR